MPKKGPTSNSSNKADDDTASNSSPGSGMSVSVDLHNYDDKDHRNLEKAGWLYKWTNYVRGYRQRWFVLDANGTLSYYRNPSEVMRACRGNINLTEANIHSYNEGHSLVITAPSSQTFHLKASNEIDLSHWLKALEYAKHRAIKKASTIEDDENEAQLLIKTKGLKELSSNKLDLMAASVRSLSAKFSKELDGFVHYSVGHTNVVDAKKCAEKAKHVKTHAENLLKNTDELLSKYKQGYETLLRIANSQNEKYTELQRQYKILARQHSQLERDAYNSMTSGTTPADERQETDASKESSPYIAASTPAETDEEVNEEDEAEDDEEETFHDAIDNLEVSGGNPVAKKSNEIMGNSVPGNKFDLHKCVIQFAPDQAEYIENTNPVVSTTNKHVEQRRASIPPKPESHGLNLWSVMRNCIGKELTRIPIPVNFNEPLSMLQRITEDLEYSYLIDRAAEKDDICERLAYIAAFAVTCYSATAKRTTKPFNPLLGETFEFDRRTDLGWRSLVEQVSHHPPAAAHYVEGAKWKLHQEFMVSSRFRGKYLSVIPTGHTHIEFNDEKANCTFQKVTTTVHNIIVGRLWIDNHGEMNVINHSGGERAILKFYAYSYFSNNRPRKVEGVILDRKGVPRFCIEGYWDSYLNIAQVIKQRTDEKGRLVLQNGEKRRIWTVNQPQGDASQYFFTKLAIEMNEPDESVAPTDSRRRPDQRLMENGKWDEANRRKNQLEEKQRKVRRQAEDEAERAMNSNMQPDEYSARWFRKVQDSKTGSVIHVIRDEEYWRCKDAKDWSRCPNIF